MTVAEIFKELSAHMIKGLMIHEHLANYYNFLGLCGYKRCHQYHYLAETRAHIRLNNYYLEHHNALIPEAEISNPDVIPANWYRYTRQDVDAGTKKAAVKTGLTMWVNWERETKKLYEQMYKELMDIGEVASAMFIKELLCDVTCELKKAEKYQLNKEATGYDMATIIGEQKSKHDKYKRMMHKL